MAKTNNQRSRARREEEEMEKAYRSTSGSRKRTKKNNQNHRKIVVIAICIAVVAILVGIVAGVIYFSNAEDSGLILDNVTVAGVNVGGMSKADAISAVRLATYETYTQKNMVIRVLNSQVELTPAQSGADLDVAAAVDAAYGYGRTGSSSQKQQEQLTAMTSGYAVDIIPYLSLDTDAVKSAVNELGTYYSSILTQTAWKVTGQRPDLSSSDISDGQTLVITMGTPEYTLDLDALYALVLDAYNSNTFLAEGECTALEPDALDLEEIHSKYCVAPVDASIDPKTFEVIKETYGYGFVIEDVKALMEKAEYGEVLEIAFTRTAPEITSDTISATLYRDVLGTFTARDESEENRDTNLRLACEAINGMILYPGDVFSYNDALGQRTAEKGYKPGPSYSGNDTVYTLGGGICQVSTALYYSTLVADLEIISRDNHGFLPAYAVYGMDAVVSWGTLDFMFRNNTNYPIRIEAAANGGVVTVTLVGTDEKDYYIEMDYKILNTYEYSTTYKEMSANNSEGYKDGDYIVDPYTGYDVETYKCKYDKTTKALLSKDLVDTSNYRKRDAVICKIKEDTPVTDPTDPVTPSDPGGNGGISDGAGALPDE